MSDRERRRRSEYNYGQTLRGQARDLRFNHGFSVPDSLTLAARRMDPHERCAICGIPAWVVWTFHARGGPFLSNSRGGNRRLHVDHIEPGGAATLDNIRLCCCACNTRRGANRYTDEEVLAWVSWRWRNAISHRLLWWLNDSPGLGGRLHRSKRCALSAAQYASSPASQQSRSAA